jgi:replicative DNA helicase
MARELDVPVLALSQLSRAVETRGGRPRLSDLRDSGSIEQDADLVMFIHREDKDSRSEKREEQNGFNQFNQEPIKAEIIIAKHRNGATGTVDLHFHEKHTRFEDIDDHHSGSSYGSEETIVEL